MNDSEKDQAIYMSVEIIARKNATEMLLNMEIMRLQKKVALLEKLYAGAYDSFVKNQTTVEAVIKNNRLLADKTKLH